jgi:hypothetical protein
MPPLSTRSKIFLTLLVLLASAEFVVRGPVRFLQAADFNDFISPYIQSRALIQGMDPYSPEVLVRFWPVEGAHRPQFLAKELADGTLIEKRGIPTAYPLTCLLLLIPLAVLPWPVAHLTWLVITTCLIFAVIGSLLSLLTAGELSGSDWRAYVFVAFALALAPLHTGVAAGSIVVSTVALCGIALSHELRRNGTLAGILLGMAVCLKPQIGLPFFAYYILRRRWRLSAIAAGVVLTAAMLAILRLAISGTPWVQNYRIDNKVLLVRGILADFTERNPLRFGLINLQVLFYAILHSSVAATAFAFAISVFLFGIWLWLLLRSGFSNHDALLAICSLAVLSLFPVYHRLYDAFLLIFPLCWGLREFSGPRTKLARAALLLMLPFLLPGGSVLEQLQRTGKIPDSIARSWYWICIVMPHEIWILLLLSFVLLGAMASNPASEFPSTFGLASPSSD